MSAAISVPPKGELGSVPIPVRLVIGVGINWTNPVPETGINLESWQASQDIRPISCLEMLTSRVLLGIESGMECLFQEGVSILLSRYCDLLTNMGDRVCVNNHSGIVVGVTDQGNLRLKMVIDNTNELAIPEISVEPGIISLGYSKTSV